MLASMVVQGLIGFMAYIADINLSSGDEGLGRCSIVFPFEASLGQSIEAERIICMQKYIRISSTS